ncbi:transposase [Staphylococcus aureus]|nr:transposase [Staphylococcus aureus]SGS46230.1 transposase [Staphylococcus aureus]SGU96264.1 transposase [Staphylococcus aureus]
MSYNHLTLTERSSIEVLLQENYSLRSITSKLKQSVSTISREISRNNVNHSLSDDYQILCLYRCEIV